MQNGGGEGGFLHKSALGLQLPQKFSPGSGNPRFASRPLPTPPPHARRDQQHIPLVARPAETSAKRLRKTAAKGPRASEAAGRPRGAAGGGGKNTAVPGRPRGGCPAGRTAGRGLEGRGEDERGRGGASAGLGPPRRGRTKPKPPPAHPHPHPGASERKGNWGQGAEPGLGPVGSDRGSRPLPPRAGARLTRAELGPPAGPVRISARRFEND